MLQPGTQVEMTKGYKGVRGRILERTESPYGFFVVELENGIHLIAGTSSFVVIAGEGVSAEGN